ncbi:MAG: M56 family metallopeptidase [Chitinophagaceae bacterium]
MNFLIYLFQIIAYSGILWLIYIAAFRSKTNHRGSRIFLLLASVLPLLLPFLKLNFSTSKPIWMERIQLDEILVRADGVQQNVAASHSFNWLLLYTAIAFALFAFSAFAYGKIFFKIRNSSSFERINGLEVRKETGIGPGSFWTTIFFPKEEIDASIFNHEAAHIHCLHRYDLVLLQVLTIAFWANPFSWTFIREIKMVHEFEADEIALANTDFKHYSELLLSNSFGTPVAVAHSFFHHPLKRRIIMLQNISKSRNAKAGIFLAAFCTAMVAVSAIYAQSAQSNNANFLANNSRQNPALQKWVKDSYKPSSNDFRQVFYQLNGQNFWTLEGLERKNKLAHVQKPSVLPSGQEVYNYVETMPSFKGALGQFMSENLHYPAASKAQKHEGRCLIQFIVDVQGRVVAPVIVQSSGYAELDAEALHVVKMMPTWNAGEIKGKAVNVFYTFPVRFSLKGDGDGC